jgi:hypothetical protein
MPQLQGTESTGHRPSQFVKRYIVDDVPDDLAVCEFDCRREHCTQDQWANCERRIRKGVEELFPDARPSCVRRTADTSLCLFDPES